MTSRRTVASSLLLALLLFVLGGFPAATSAHKIPPKPASPPPPGSEKGPLPSGGEGVQLPQDVKARQRLEVARDYVDDRAWPDAVRQIQTLLDARTDSFRRVTTRDKNGSESHQWRSIRLEAEELLASLPKEGKEFYRATYETKARKELTAARAHNDTAALRDLVRRYRHTSAGREALVRLASYYLDRDQPALADACYQQLRRLAGIEQIPSLTLFKTTLAARLAHVPDVEALPEWRKLVERIGADGLVIDKETYAVDKLRELLRRWPNRSTDDSPLYRGDAARSGRGRGEGFLLEPHWRIDTFPGTPGRALAQAKGTLRRPALPAATPLAMDGKLFFRSAYGVHALDAQSGRLLWRCPLPRSVAAILNSPAQRSQLEIWLNLYAADRAVLVENSLLGTLSSDGARVYAIDDLPLPPPLSLAQQDPSGGSWAGPLRPFIGSNVLRALDAPTGKGIWEVAAARLADPKLDAFLSAAYFLGPPLPLGRQLYAVVEVEQEAHLLCLDAESGRVQWKQRLAMARNKMLLDVVRHTQAVHLAYAEGVLVCPTHSGAIFGVDPLSRSLLWVHLYAPPQAPKQNDEAETPAMSVRSGWKNAAPIIQGGRVVFTPPDSDAIFCLRLHDGSLAWKATRSADDWYTGCIHKGGVLVVGRTACRMLRLDSGEVLWQRPIACPGGQGVAAGSLYYLPLRDGSLLALNLDSPQDSQRIESRGMRGELGNLLFHHGMLCAQSAGEIMGFVPWTTQLARLEERLRGSPHDSSLLLERGRLRLEHGETAAAVADLRDALRSDPAPGLRSAIHERLFDALTQLLQQDFAGGEKYLDEYRTLCRTAIPAAAESKQRSTLEQEARRRESQYFALVALGREKQGRVVEALAAYRELSRRSEQGMTVPDDPALRTRPDLWVRHRVAELIAHAAEPQRRLLYRQIRQEGQVLLTSFDRAALLRYLALFGGVQGEEAATIAEIRLHLARLLARASGKGHALEAELLLHQVWARSGNNFARLQAQALHERALLLTRWGLLDEALADYRRLAEEHGPTVVHDGRTAVQLLEDLQTDRRFLPYLQPLPALPAARKRRPASPFLVTCVPSRPLPNETITAFLPDALRDPQRQPPDWTRRLRFTVDGRALRLRAVDRASGAEAYTIPLPLPSVPASLRDREIPFLAIDHLLVLRLGRSLLAIDLLQRRVRWKASIFGDATAQFQSSDPLGSVGPSAVCVHAHGALTAFDPATGEIRWTRSEGRHDLHLLDDGERLFLIEQSQGGSVRAVHVLRTHDGTAMPLADAIAAHQQRRKQR